MTKRTLRQAITGYAETDTLQEKQKAEGVLLLAVSQIENGSPEMEVDHVADEELGGGESGREMPKAGVVVREGEEQMVVLTWNGECWKVALTYISSRMSDSEIRLGGMYDPEDEYVTQLVIDQP